MFLFFLFFYDIHSHGLGEQLCRYPRPLGSVFTSITHSISPLNSTRPPQPQPLAPHTTTLKSHLPLFPSTPSIWPLRRPFPVSPSLLPSLLLRPNLEGEQERSGQTKVTVFPPTLIQNTFLHPHRNQTKALFSLSLSTPSLSLNPSLSPSLYK